MIFFKIPNEQKIDNSSQATNPSSCPIQHVSKSALIAQIGLLQPANLQPEGIIIDNAAPLPLAESTIPIQK